MGKKYKIGYTTGVFDMFHIGHLNILKKAKEQCEYLIVAVSTDELAREYKHKTPVICFDDRFAIVEAIKYADKVVPQNSLDKKAAWEVFGFDAVFHGDDWKGSAMYDEIEKSLNEVGVDVVYIPHTKGVSSTILSEKLKESGI